MVEGIDDLAGIMEFDLHHQGQMNRFSFQCSPVKFMLLDLTILQLQQNSKISKFDLENKSQGH